MKISRVGTFLGSPVYLTFLLRPLFPSSPTPFRSAVRCTIPTAHTHLLMPKTKRLSLVCTSLASSFSNTVLACVSRSFHSLVRVYFRRIIESFSSLLAPVASSVLLYNHGQNYFCPLKVFQQPSRASSTKDPHHLQSFHPSSHSLYIPFSLIFLTHFFPCSFPLNSVRVISAPPPSPIEH